jgi:hypothetical protein
LSLHKKQWLATATAPQDQHHLQSLQLNQEKEHAERADDKPGVSERQHESNMGAIHE